jgi:hypothetical protein
VVEDPLIVVVLLVQVIGGPAFALAFGGVVLEVIVAVAVFVHPF